MKNLTLPILTLLLLPASAAADDYNFIVPVQCQEPVGQFKVTGADGAETGDPPVVTVTYDNGKVVGGTPRVLPGSLLSWYIVDLPLPDVFATYLVTTTYTPFLQSYIAVSYQELIKQPFYLPFPSWNRQQIVPKVIITIQDQSGSPIRNGYLEMAPNFGGSSPYTLKADGNGEVPIYCFTIYVDGNPATVLDANHNLLYATTVIVDSSTGRGVARPAQ
jgi:hypothetical protein